MGRMIGTRRFPIRSECLTGADAHRTEAEDPAIFAGALDLEVSGFTIVGAYPWGWPRVGRKGEPTPLGMRLCGGEERGFGSGFGSEGGIHFFWNVRGLAL